MQTQLRYLSLVFSLTLLGSSAYAVSIEAWYAVVEADGVQRVNVSCGSNFIDPKEIVVKRNVPVDFVVRTLGSAPDQSFFVQIPGQALERVVGRIPISVRVLPNIVGSHAIFCQGRGGPDTPKAQTKKRGILTIAP